MHRARHSEASRAIRPRLAIALVVASAGLATAIWLPSRFDSAEATEGNRERSQGQSEIFSDDFGGDRGSAVDRRKWSLARGVDEPGELQFYTDGTRNARLDGDGNLVITARAEDRARFTSAKLRTDRTFTGESGRAEARIKVPESQGVRSAFQVLGAADLTVMENLGRSSRTIRGAAGPVDQTLDADRPFSDDFHIYAVDWSPGLVVWSVDGQEFLRTTDAAAFAEPFTLVLDLAVGGDRAGEPRSRDRFPQRMIVDFVKVSVTEDAAETPPPSTEPTTPPTTEPTTPPATTPPATTPPATTPPATTPPATTPPAPEPTTPPATTPPPVAEDWKPFTLYEAGQQVRYDGVTYEVLAPHTSLPGWEPPVVKLLFKAR